MQKRLSSSFLIITILFAFTVMRADTLVSPFNHKQVTGIDTLKDFHFLVSGHFHGASTNVSGYPASTLQANLDTINLSGASFLISLGDLFLDVNEQTIKNYSAALFSRLQIPMFNAVGNHDISSPLYSERFGKTTQAFKTANTLFVILDTEINDGSIMEEQLQLLKKLCAQLNSDPEKLQLFIFSHRPVWAESDPAMKKILTDNTQSLISNNYSSDVMPVLNSIKRSKKVYWISGSMGGSAPASFLYHRNDNMIFMLTSIRDLKRDAILDVSIHGSDVKLSGISLTGQKLRSIDSYTIKFWEEKQRNSKSLNYRLIPYLSLQMLKHYYFWIGFALAAILSFSIYLFFRRKNA
jgi:hypothetical protein